MGEGATRRAVVLRAAATLAAAGIDQPRLDAEVLLAEALGLPRLAMLVDLDAPVPDDVRARVEAWVARRTMAEPVAYIVGHREFWSLDFTVTPATLIPRPDSETLVQAAVAAWPRQTPLRVLDLGTGSGCLLLAVLHEFPRATGLGVDRSAAALAVAAGNARVLELEDRATFVTGDWGSAIAGPFDCILANPPYIATGEVLARDVAAHEPATALFAGPDGLDDYRRIIPDLPRLLAPAGRAFVEVGATQAAAVSALARSAGLTAVTHPDLAGHPRCVELSGPQNPLGMVARSD
ncbi:peptide chain release factor N(5)-glutamine methyltransferase [Parapedomonas caeni]